MRLGLRVSCALVTLLCLLPLDASAQRRTRRARPTPADAPAAPAEPTPVAVAPVVVAPPTPTDLVAQGEAAYEEGDFESALAAFSRAEEAGVDRALWVRILSRRVLIAHAMGDTSTLETQALRLVSLEPEALGGEASPDVARALARARERADGVVRLRIEHEVVGESLALRARVDGDVAGMVREVRLRARRGDGAMSDAVAGVATVTGTDMEGVVLVAECVGPGGAVLAELGTEAAPHPLSQSVAEEIIAAPATSDDTGLHIGLVVGGVVVVAAAAVVLGVVLGSASGQLTGPVVTW